MKDFLMVIGAASLIGFGILLLTFAWEGITELISNLKRNYRYKHRFDKSPTAKCYCVDCVHHNNKTGRCYRFHEDSTRLTADCWFCYAAEPRKKESED